jgi:hypothetical protein
LTSRKASKNPDKVRAGHLGAARRWAGYARTVVRIGDLTSEQRLLVLALIQAARESGSERAVGEAAPTAELGGHGNDRSAG